MIDHFDWLALDIDWLWKDQWILLNKSVIRFQVPKEEFAAFKKKCMESLIYGADKININTDNVDCWMAKKKKNALLFIIAWEKKVE